ncbi:MAG: TolC family protein [bacterium]|nr:TolC family protein [bacterium]
MRKYFILVLTFFWIQPAQAQMGLSECVKIALANNPGLKISETEASMTLEDARQAKSALLPSLDFSGNYRRQSTTPELTIPSIELPIGGAPISLFPGGGMTLGTLDNYDFKLTISQPIFTGFRLSNWVKAANALATSRSLELEKNRIELIFKVETAYGNVLKSQKFLQIASSAREQVASHLQDVENYVAQGMAKKDELLKVQVKLSEAELVVIQAENAIKMAMVALENLIGQKLPSDVTLASMQVQEFVEAGQASIKIAKGGMFPSLAAFGTLGYGKPGLDFIKQEWMDYWLVGAGVEWNLWSWGKIRSQIQQAQLKIDAINQTARKVQDAITLDVTQSCLLLDEASKRLQLTSTMETQAQESFRVAETSYQQGQATHTEYFDAQSELTRAKLQKAQAEIDAALAQANWRRAVGTNAKSNK